jgi:hypothetical protein
MWEPEIRSDMWLDCELVVDGRRGYGIQDIYGFVGEVWRNQLELR